MAETGHFAGNRLTSNYVLTGRHQKGAKQQHREQGKREVCSAEVPLDGSNQFRAYGIKSRTSKFRAGACGIFYFFSTTCIESSSSCLLETGAGAPIRRSCAFLFIGNAIISRIDSSFAKSMTILSIPGAIPA